MTPRDICGIPIRRRFFLYILAFLIFMSFGGIAALSLSGGWRTARETVILLGKERDHLAQNVKRQFSDTSAQVVSLSRALSASLEKRLAEQGLSISELNGKPDILTDILGDEINRLLLYLAKTKCGGVFFALNATVNPGAEGANFSRAGLYIRNIDRGFTDRNSDRLFLRGPAQIGIAEDFTLQARWTPEFDVRGQLFWERPLKILEENPSLPLSRLYYWYFTASFPGLNENTIVCCAPLLDGEGRFLGVCGFETGAKAFARNNVLDIDDRSNATGLFFEFTSSEGKRFHSDEALFTGNAALWHKLSKRQELVVMENFHGLQIFKHGNDNAYMGLWSDIPLYPGDSPFTGQRFAAAVIVAEEDFCGIVSASRLRIALIGALLLCAGLALSLFLSGRYEKPFKEILKSLESGDTSVKSNIQEIDDLLEFMRAQLNKASAEENALAATTEGSEENAGTTSEDSIDDLLDGFIANTKKLTRAETNVFNLYFEGHTAQEIASILNVSVNTVKTHNRRIFAKLNVSSRKELLAWVQMLTASGRSLDDSRQKQFDKIRNIVKNMQNAP